MIARATYRVVGAAQTAWTAIGDWAIPPGVRAADTNELRHARVVLAFCAVMLPCPLVFALIYQFALGQTVAAVTCLAAFLVIPLIPLTMRRRSVHAAATLAMCDYVGTMLVLMCLTGGGQSPVINWLVAAPLIATGVGGGRAGLGWALFTTLAIGIIFAANALGVGATQPLTPAQVHTLGILALFALFPVVLAFACMYELQNIGMLRRMQESEKRVRAILENVQTGVVLIDAATRTITEANPAAERLLGASRATLIGAECQRFLCADGVDKCPALDPTAVIVDVEGVLRRVDGGAVPVIRTVAPLLMGGQRRLLVSIVDISAQKQAAAQIEAARQAAEAATRAKSEFLANMSHEVRTPMTAILGFADVLLENADFAGGPAEQMEAIKTIKSNGEYLLRIINDILDLSKIEAGKMTVERIPCAPGAVVAEVTSLVGVRARAKGLPLKVAYEGPIPETIRTDPVRLRQILVNLLANAIKFTECGEVALTAQVFDGDAPRMQFDIVDTGVGMTAEQAAQVFQPFTQADMATTRRFGGSGLGLAISKRLAEMLGGDVVLVWTEPGVGTHFRLSVATGSLVGVPRRAAGALTPDASRVPKVQSGSDDGEPLRGLHVLLAEDGLDNQRLIAHFLRRAGASVTLVENGKRACDVVLAAREVGRTFDVVLMDMQMPVMDGYQATRVLRQADYAGAIIALTAHAMAEDRDKCLRAGCDDYASKPIDRRRLLETVVRHARKTPVDAPAGPG